MKLLLIDIAMGLTIAILIIFWPHERTPSLSFSDAKGVAFQPNGDAIIEFWSIKSKPSHRDLQLIQRFTQSHTDIQKITVHAKYNNTDELQNFLVDLGIYSTIYFCTDCPSQIPTTILMKQNQITVLDHSPHYEQLMEFFEKDF